MRGPTLVPKHFCEYCSLLKHSLSFNHDRHVTYKKEIGSGISNGDVPVAMTFRYNPSGITEISTDRIRWLHLLDVISVPLTEDKL